MLVSALRKAFSPRNLAATTILSLTAAGVAYAAIGSAQIANNSITGLDLKNNSVGTADITNNSLTGLDVRNNSLTGADVNESKLGKVPAAGAADTATTATTATTAASATNAANADKLGGKASSDFVLADTRKFFGVKLAGGASQTIATNGPVSLTARCTLNDAGSDRIDILAATTVDGAFLSGNDNLSGGTTPATDYLNVATTENDRQLLINSTTTTNQNVSREIDSGYVLGPEGSFIGINGESVSLGLNAFGSVCIAVGYVDLGKLS